MREVHRVKVIDFLPANRFEKVLQGELNKLSEEGFKVETEIKMTNSRFFSAVLIGKREPFAKHPFQPIETKIDVQIDGRTLGQKIADFTGITPPSRAAEKFYSNGLDYSRKQNKPE